MEEKKYTVSEDGMTIITKYGNKKKYRIRNGKYEVDLNIYGTIQTCMVARIVYNYFNPHWDLKSKFVIGYKDGNPLNVHKDNLFIQKRTKTIAHKLNEEQEENIKRMYIYRKMTMKDMAEKYGVSTTLIKKIVKKEEL